jgi:hypothetical protein
MKHLLILLMLPFTFSGGAESVQYPPAFNLQQIPDEQPKIEVVEEYYPNYLLEALIQVESRGNQNAVGDRHLSRPSVGVLQIRPIMVKEVNRILKKLKAKKKYTLEDRYSREKSVEMFYIWQSYHLPDSSDEVIARCWNGGPKGWKRNSTLHYWNKVKNEINNLKSNNQ